MSKKKIFYFFGLIFVLFLATGCLKKESDIKDDKTTESKLIQAKSIKQKELPKKYDLYSTTPYEISLYSILEISKKSDNLKKIIDNLLEQAQGFYLLTSNNNKTFIILQNPIERYNTYQRHNLQFAEIDENGQIYYHNAGYNGINGEIFEEKKTKRNNWVIDKTSEYPRPIKHIAYDEKGKLSFIEIWNYDENEPIKYQMKDANKKVVSILKETVDENSNYIKEHIFYDNNGNITMSLVAYYEGANISRLTFYNSNDLLDSISIISEYSNGNKTKELIYNGNYEHINTITSEYNDTDRIKINLFDKDNNKIKNINS